MSLETRRQNRQSRRDFNTFVPSSPEELAYYEVAKRVKRMKGFYKHAFIYLVINVIIMIINIQNLKVGESYFKLENFFTAFFWGIGLLSHAFSIFGPELILGKNWEEKKIKEFMDKESTTWK